MEFDDFDLIGDIDWNIDWDTVFDDTNALDSSFQLEAPPPHVSASSSSTVEDAPAPHVETGPVDAWIGEVENILMKEDDGGSKAALEEEPPKEYCEKFFADILVDSPSTESEKEKSGGSPINNYIDADVDADADADDPVSKKRRRQLRNKDAAIRSRERKKMYVADLEMKSRYLEGECRRLGRFLQCCYAENHALRLSLQMGNVYGRSVSGTKQESAVLVMELLLLGSLLWFLDLTCRYPLPLVSHLLILTLNQEPAHKRQESVALRARGEASKMVLAIPSRGFVKTRKCRASRTKMKYFCSSDEFRSELCASLLLTS